ncbi:MAG: family 16 glycoside hydrolase, partial [Planctomycetota bacterium]
EGAPWPKRYQANLRKGMEGNVGGLEGAKSEGLTKPGDWNHFKLSVVGTTAAMEINGQPAWKADGLESDSGYICIQSEVPGGGQFLFRNLRITELGYRSLFDGSSLAGWEEVGGGGECWKAEDGLLICTGKRGSWLRSIEEHGDFNLRLEYRLKPEGNSGVYARVPESGNHHGENAGVEIQILDDPHPRYANLQPYQFTGSVYAVAAARERVGRPTGQWNTMEINCRGTDYRVTHNGIVVVDAKAAEFPELSGRRLTGFLGLQNHSEEVCYRNFRIGPPQP